MNIELGQLPDGDLALVTHHCRAVSNGLNITETSFYAGL